MKKSNLSLAGLKSVGYKIIASFELASLTAIIFTLLVFFAAMKTFELEGGGYNEVESYATAIILACFLLAIWSWKKLAILAYFSLSAVFFGLDVAYAREWVIFVIITFFAGFFLLQGYAKMHRHTKENKVKNLVLHANASAVFVIVFCIVFFLKI